MAFPKKFYPLALAAMMIIATMNISSGQNKQKSDIIIDSDMTLAEAMKGSTAPKDVYNSQRLVTVKYYSMDGKIHQGQLVVHKDRVKDIREIFKIILETKFPVEKCVPIVKYNWQDTPSMEDNNTSSFCYRLIAGTKRISNHAFGKAIDINPRINPFVRRDGSLSPSNGSYNKKVPGTFYEGQRIVKEFKKRGWRWGGNFKSIKDYQHFDKK